MKSFAILGVLGVALLAPAARGQNQAIINLAGVQFKNGVNQSRDSLPSHIAPAFGYRYHIEGLVKGDSGLLAVLYPNPTPLAQVLETLAPGSAQYLDDEGYNPTGALPLEILNAPFSGTTVILGITVNVSATVSGGIRADGAAYFNLTSVVIQPSFLVGSMTFTSGQAVTTRIPAVTGDMNWDGTVDFFDIDAFVLGLLDPETYISIYGYDPIYPGDLNRDNTLDFFDIDPFVALVLG